MEVSVGAKVAKDENELSKISWTLRFEYTQPLAPACLRALTKRALLMNSEMKGWKFSLKYPYRWSIVKSNSTSGTSLIYW